MINTKLEITQQKLTNISKRAVNRYLKYMTIINDTNILELANRINEWEIKAGECFKDYFMHDSIINADWFEFLESKGYSRRVSDLKTMIERGSHCLCQSLLYDIVSCYTEDSGKEIYTVEYVEYRDDKEKHEALHHQDRLLWAEFLLSDQIYKSWVEEFLTTYF